MFCVPYGLHEIFVYVGLGWVKNCAHHNPHNFPGNIPHRHTFITLEIFVHNSVRAGFCVGSLQKQIYKISFVMPRKKTDQFLYRPACVSFRYPQITITDLQRSTGTSRKDMQFATVSIIIIHCVNLGDIARLDMNKV